MTNIVKALIWAAAILIVALLKSRGLISVESAQTLFIVLPLLAVLSLRRSGSSMCGQGTVS
ncbi:MAG: hypothetical protein KJ872_05825 [Alphaproteobacteria bacterium]|nr:hypothetical protein [Alphaproteobacteria bacterium]